MPLFNHRPLAPLSTLCLALGAMHSAHAATTVSPVQFTNCSEFVGLIPIDAAKAQTQLPSGYTLVLSSNGSASLVVRMSDCKSIRVGDLPAKAGRLAQIGLLIVSPDGTASDPNTGINNYTLSYASNDAQLVHDLDGAGVPAVLDPHMEYSVTPPLGTGSDLYAAVAPETGASPRFFLSGAVNTPTFVTTFLANWWRSTGSEQTRMQTNIPTIVFDFASVVTFTTNPANIIGELMSTSQNAAIPVTYRGTFDAGTMMTTVSP